MPQLIAPTHPTIALKPKIQEVTQNFLNAFGFNYFQYLRCFADGSICLLTNNTSIIEYFQYVDNSPVVFSSFKEEHQQTHSYWTLWDEELPKEPVQIVREKFHFHNGLTLVRRSKHYYDMIGFALPLEQPNPGSYYLNKLKAIEQFIYDFDQDNKDLITLMNKNPISLPEVKRDKNYQSICLTNGKVQVQGKEGLTYVTAQELACLRILVQGATYKEIAKILEISPRTVETFILRVKQRTGFQQRKALESMMHLSQCV